MALDKDEIIEQVTEIAEEAGELASSFVEERVKPVVTDALDKATAAADVVMPRVEKAAATVAEAAKPVVEQVGDVTRDAIGRAVDFVEEKASHVSDGPSTQA